MRRVLAERRGVKPGHLVVVSMALGKDQKFARIGLWSAAPGTDLYSPHCDVSPADVDGLPVMVPVRRWSLDYRFKGAVATEWTATEALDYRLVQEIDSHAEAAPITRMTSHGPYRQAIRRIVARVFGIARRGHGAVRRSDRERPARVPLPPAAS